MGSRQCHHAAPPLITPKTGGGGDGVRIQPTRPRPARRVRRTHTPHACARARKIRKYTHVVLSIIILCKVLFACVVFVHVMEIVPNIDGFFSTQDESGDVWNISFDQVHSVRLSPWSGKFTVYSHCTYEMRREKKLTKCLDFLDPESLRASTKMETCSVLFFKSRNGTHQNLTNKTAVHEKYLELFIFFSVYIPFPWSTLYVSIILYTYVTRLFAHMWWRRRSIAMPPPRRSRALELKWGGGWYILKGLLQRAEEPLTSRMLAREHLIEWIEWGVA